MRLTEKYRPRTLDDVVGQPKAVATVRGILARGGFGGRCVWLSGPSGAGKTTLARIIAAEVADPTCTVELVARDLGAERLAELAESFTYYGFGKGGRALIVNEAHGLRSDQIERLLTLTEDLPGHVVVIFTTTREGQEALFQDHDDASPLLSRCIRVPLTNQGLSKAFAERVSEIAKAEGLDGQPIDAYVKLAQRCKNNCRAMLQEVEAGAMIPA